MEDGGVGEQKSRFLFPRKRVFNIESRSEDLVSLSSLLKSACPWSALYSIPVFCWRLHEHLSIICQVLCNCHRNQALHQEYKIVYVSELKEEIRCKFFFGILRRQRNANFIQVEGLIVFCFDNPGNERINCIALRHSRDMNGSIIAFTRGMNGSTVLYSDNLRV